MLHPCRHPLAASSVPGHMLYAAHLVPAPLWIPQAPSARVTTASPLSRVHSPVLPGLPSTQLHRRPPIFRVKNTLLLSATHLSAPEHHHKTNFDEYQALHVFYSSQQPYVLSIIPTAQKKKLRPTAYPRSPLPLCGSSWDPKAHWQTALHSPCADTERLLSPSLLL